MLASCAAKVQKSKAKVFTPSQRSEVAGKMSILDSGSMSSLHSTAGASIQWLRLLGLAFLFCFQVWQKYEDMFLFFFPQLLTP